MNCVIRSLIIGSGLALAAGCAATGKTNTFTFTADLPPSFAYVATVTYVPVAGQSCKLEKRDNMRPQFNRKWRAEYEPDAQIEIRRIRKGCELVVHSIELAINAAYGKDLGDFGRDYAYVEIRKDLDARDMGTFNANGGSQFSGECQWFFRTSGKPRILRKILYCKGMDAQGNVLKSRPFAAYTLDQLPGKTVRLNIKLADQEKPGWGDTWVKVPGGWKRCMGESFEDQHAYCNGNYTDFSTFKTHDGRICTIYPGCTENKEVTP